MTPVVAAVGLAVAFGGFEVAGRARRRLGAGEADDLGYHAWKWGVAGLLVAFVLVVEGRSPASVGWTVGGAAGFLGATAAGLAALLGANVVTSPLWERVDGADEALGEGLASFTDLSTPGRLFVAGTAGVTEELAYRGYAIERLAALTGSPLLAGAASLVAFVAAHLGETWRPAALLRIAQPAVVLTALYLWTRSLPVVMAAHGLNDAVGLLLADRFADAGADDDRADAAPSDGNPGDGTGT